MSNKILIEQDLKSVWHPCTQMKDHEKLPLVPIKSAKGVYLYDFDNKSYIDGVSSWWVNLFGHCNEYINSKIIEQLNDLEHIILAGFTHPQIVKLSNRLKKLTNLDKCFYADNGSSGVEIALKMAFHYYKNMGENRDVFISLENSYHGETIGALSVGDVKLYKDTYKQLLLETVQVNLPKNDDDIDFAIDDLKQKLFLYKGRVAGIIVEPILQCAGNMRIYPPKYLKELKDVCKNEGVLLIADEVATGFGRCGEMFACEIAGVNPDFMILSKGLSGGYLPISVVLTTDEIYGAFYCDYLEFKALLHSHSYTGNALACASANAVLDIFERESVIESNKIKTKYIAKKLENLKNFTQIENIRQIGMVCAFEIKGDFRERVGIKFYEFALKNGVLLRPLGNTIYFMPPYIVTNEQIDYVFDVIGRYLTND